MGRRKIEIKKIEKKNSLQVTFTKRRQGLFKKAAQLCILTDAQIALLAFSPGGNAYSFGHSSVESVLQHYCNGTIPDHIDSTLLDSCKNHGKGKEQQEGCSGFWWENIAVEENTNLEELERIKNGLQKLSDNVSKKLNLGLADDHALPVVVVAPDCTSSLQPVMDSSILRELEEFFMVDYNIREETMNGVISRDQVKEVDHSQVPDDMDLSFLLGDHIKEETMNNGVIARDEVDDFLMMDGGSLEVPEDVDFSFLLDHHIKEETMNGVIARDEVDDSPVMMDGGGLGVPDDVDFSFLLDDDIIDDYLDFDRLRSLPSESDISSSLFQCRSTGIA